MPGVGKQISIGIAKETTRGTSPADATFWLPWLELNIDEKKEFAEDNSSFGIVEESVGATIIGESSEGTLKGMITEDTFPLIMLSVLGAISTVANSPETGVNKHIVTVAQNTQHPTVSFYKDDPVTGQDYIFPLGALTSLELKYERGSFLSFSAPIRAQKGTASVTGLTPVRTVEKGFTHKNVTVKIASDIAGLVGATAISVSSLSVKIDPKIESDEAIGSSGPVDFLSKGISVDGSIEATWKNETEYKADFMAGNSKAMRITMENLGVTIGATSHPKIVIDLAKVIFKELNVPYKAGDIIKQTLSFTAYYSVADAKMISVEIINTKTSY